MIYIEGAAGISGDMTVGALLSLGASREKLDMVLSSLRLGNEFSYVISEKTSYGIAGTDFDVILPHHHNHNNHHQVHHEHRNLEDVVRIIDSGEMSEHARELAKKINPLLMLKLNENGEFFLFKIKFRVISQKLLCL